MKFALIKTFFYCTCWSLLALSSSAVAQSTAKPNDSMGQVIQVSNSGVWPAELSISGGDLMIFILNDTTDSLISFEIDYGDADLHCANSNVKNRGGGKAGSVIPLGPRDFNLVCFHEPGVYPIKFWGVKGRRSPVEMKVTVVSEKR